MITDSKHSNRGEGGKKTVMLMITDSNIQTEVKEARQQSCS